MGDWLMRSWDDVEKAAEASERTFADWFSISTGETKSVRFLEDAPHSIRRHFIQREGRKYFTCLEETGVECPLCAAGNKPAFAGFFTVIDYEAKEEDGKVLAPEDKLKTARFGIRALRSLMACAQRYGAINKYDIDIQCIDRDQGLYSFIPIGAPDKPIDDIYAKLEPIDHTANLQPDSPEELKAILSSEPSTQSSGEEERTIRFS